MQWRLRVSSSIAPFRDRAEKTWEIERYKWPRDIFKPVVFFGMYHWGDYIHYFFHLGPKYILWAGHDIINLLKRDRSFALLFGKARHFVENEVERSELASLGLWSVVAPSFVDDIDKYEVNEEIWGSPTRDIFISGHTGRDGEYGWELIKKISKEVPSVTFHLYGIDRVEYGLMTLKNVMCYGRVPEEQFDEEIKSYHCGLRPNKHDGNSEIAMKSVLSGGYPITYIDYPHIDSYKTEEELVRLLKDLSSKKEPNYQGREFWRDHVNQYPWNENN